MGPGLRSALLGAQKVSGADVFDEMFGYLSVGPELTGLTVT